MAAPSECQDYQASLDRADESSPNYLRWVSDLITPHLGYSVLDIGAGIGTVTELYARGHEVLATDLSDDYVAMLEQRFASWPNVNVAKKELRELAEEGHRFDSIVMTNVLEHIEDDVGILAEMKEVLRPGGNVVIYVPALNGLYGSFDRKVGHYRRYSKWRMREVARQAGLTVEHLQYANALAIPAWIAFSATDVDRTQRGSLSIWDRTGVPISRKLEQLVPMPFGLNLLASLRM